MTQPSTTRPERRRTLTAKRVTVTGNFHEACERFNSRQFWECHESLEEVWQHERGPIRDLYKGLIQVAAGFVHLTRGNSFGTRRLFTTALGYLEPYRAYGAMGWDVDAIATAVEQSLAFAETVGFDPARFDFALAPTFQFDETAVPAEARCWGAWGFDPDGAPLDMEIEVLA